MGIHIVEDGREGTSKKAKDWKGNKKTTFVTLGASNHTDHDRAEHDYYATEPKAVKYLLDVEQFEGTIWENACGAGHLAKRMMELGQTVVGTDLVNRGFGMGNTDFLTCTEPLGDNIVTNPPFVLAQEWIEHSLELLHTGKKLALLLPILFLESEERVELFKNTPPVRIHVFAKRILCAMNGDFRKRDKEGNIEYDRNGKPKRMSSAKCYAWFVWEKGNYTNKPVLDWLYLSDDGEEFV